MHCRRVAAVGQALAHHLFLPTEQKSVVYAASLLHHYHFELFALDKRLPMEPDTPLPELLNALKGNTIAKADLVAIYEAPPAQ